MARQSVEKQKVSSGVQGNNESAFIPMGWFKTVTQSSDDPVGGNPVPPIYQ